MADSSADAHDIFRIPIRVVTSSYQRAAEVVESGACPLFSRSVLESRIAHLPPEERFRHGLDRVLEGIGAQLAAISPGARRSRS